MYRIHEELKASGKDLEFLGKLMTDSTKDGFFLAIDRRVFMDHAHELHPSFADDLGDALIAEVYLRESEHVVVFPKKEVGSLFVFTPGTVGTIEAIALVDYLLKIPSMMSLNNAQIVELELLLNKAGKSLGIPMPHVRPATYEEMVAGLHKIGLTLESLRAKPRAFYNRFVDVMKAEGIPVSMKSKEFLPFAEEALSS